jgi:hypothetical protein
MSNDSSNVPSYEDYYSTWVETLGIEPDEVELREEEELMLSIDLKEATYLIPPVVLQENVSFMDNIMGDFAPWLTHRSLFASFERDVDMGYLADKGYYEGPEIVRSTRGSFMGDGLSFIHLTLLMVGCVRAVYSVEGVARPLGQSVGDDLVLLKTKLKQALELLSLMEQLGCEFSKLNSVCKDAATFCETYMAQVSDLEAYEDLQSMKNSIFKDLAFLDTIKGSILSGFSKVKQDKGDPFIGHANMLNKQVGWHPTASVKERSKVFLWANNYMSAHRLGSSMASLPTELGGVNLAVGPTVSFNDESFQEKWPYYEAILDLDRKEFLQYFTLLQGIYRANPKGFKWSNDFELIKKVIEDCEIFDIPNLNTIVPSYMHKETPMKKLTYIQNELGMVSFRQLSGYLARQQAFLNCWDGKIPNSFTTLLSKDSKQRANKAWGIIKTNLVPVERDRLRFHTFNALKSAISEKTWGLYVRKDDPSLIQAFAGMPTLFVDFGDNN